MSLLPTFVVIGAAKAGTTSVCDLLGAHTDVFVTDPKEPHFFSRITAFEDRREWYASPFEGAGDAAARGEGSTSYTHPNRISFTAPRLREHVPDCRLIYLVRHPVRRLESDWKMRRLEGRAPESIGQAVDRNASLLTFGFYWSHLSVYRELFPDEQIRVVFLEDLARDPETELRALYRHIGVDPDFVPPGLGRPRNTSTSRAQSVAIENLVRTIPGGRRISSLLPEVLKELVRETLARPEDHEPVVEWAPRELEAVETLYRKDSRKLLAHCGKSADFWELDTMGRNGSGG